MRQRISVSERRSERAGSEHGGTAANQPACPGAFLPPWGEHFRAEGEPQRCPIPSGARLSWGGGATLVPKAGSCLLPTDGETQHAPTGTGEKEFGKLHTKDPSPTPNGMLASTVTACALI